MSGHASGSQEWEVDDMLQRAKSSPDRHGRLRQEALKRLINLAHSESTSLKILAAKNIRFFFTDFPDLEEEAVDAIYDLCEDSSPEVRLEGYLAITEVSRTRGGWVKRNADVLVQLLQSEEADEVAVVKKALVEHLEMEPKITLGVLYDQIVFGDDTSDKEELAIREHLRTLVLGFMAGEAKQAICKRHAIPGAVGEPVLYEGLFAAIPRLRLDDLELVLNDLVYALPAFTLKKPSERGSELLKLLLVEKTSPTLREDLHSNSKSLSKTRQILQICVHITCDLQAAPAVDLLQFFCASLIGKITLQKMQVNDQQWVVSTLARILGTAERQPRNPRLLPLRRTIADACPYLLEVLKKSTGTRAELAKTYPIFLSVCFERAKESPWTPPPHLLKMLQEFSKWPEFSQNQDYERMLRSLAVPNRTLTPSASMLQTKAAEKTSLSQIPPSRAYGVPIVGSVPNLSSSVRDPAFQDRTKRDLGPDVSARPAKRSKVEEATSPPKMPTLLSRLGTSIGRQSSLPDLSSRSQAASPAPKDKPSPQLSQGLSIKGAAAKQANQDISLSSRVAPSSLLERLQDSWLGDATSQQQEVGRKRRNV
ncbi:hypothetical protein D9756_005246 [Leucocoprinus leucothites]|uniref:Uncharacterized protein n=1 Tax=Leucocoprinus leucothites TaxID=201217 RepID=A0A8H5D7M2_9AGAR|nr:hypothetical protein D9756_005246 [Leucoagaricus leucothites]